MNPPDGAPARLTLAQALGWGLVIAIIAALVVAFFVYGRQVRPLLGR